MEEQFVYCGSPHYEPHGKPMNNIKFLSNKKLTCKFFYFYFFTFAQFLIARFLMLMLRKHNTVFD